MKSGVYISKNFFLKLREKKDKKRKEKKHHRLHDKRKEYKMIISKLNIHDDILQSRITSLSHLSIAMLGF